MKNKARGGADGKSDTRHGSPKPREERTHMTLDELTEGVPVEAHEAITCEGELYRVHPAASEFDLLPDDQLQSLADDIALHGLDNAILRNRDGLILDGRNRLHACRMAGVTPRFRMYEGDDQVAKIISCNLERRHLNENERALMAVRMVPHIEAEADKGGRPAKVEPSLALVDDEKPSAILRSVSKKERKSTAQAARSMKVAPRRVEQMKRVVENAPDLVPEVTKGKMSLSKAESVVKDRQAGIEDHHRDSWYTPRWLFEQLGAMFEQDVCAPPDTDHRTCPANAYFTKRVKALTVGGLYPHLTLQAYTVGGRLLSAAVARTSQLYTRDVLSSPYVYKQVNGYDGSEFLVIPWSVVPPDYIRTVATPNREEIQ